MKKIYFLLLAFSLFTTANAQIVNIPDANFKTILLEGNATKLDGNYSKIDANNDREIQNSEALNVSELNLNLGVNRYNGTTDLTGIQSFLNLKILICPYLNLRSLDVSKLINLTKLICEQNKLQSLDVSMLANLTSLRCNNNMMTSLDVSRLLNLIDLDCSFNTISSLDCSKNKNLKSLYVQSVGLKDLFIKNGSYNLETVSFLTNYGFSNNPDLKYICADEFEIVKIKTILDDLKMNTVVNSNCSVDIGGNFIVNIPDANFKAKLLAASTTNLIARSLAGNFFKIDINNDGQIQQSEALSVSELNIKGTFNNSISDLTGIQNFENLNYLDCSNNNLSSLDVSSLINLFSLNCSYNKLTTLNISKLFNLRSLNCRDNLLNSLSASSSVNLTELICTSNKLTSLNVSSLVNLQSLYCGFNLLSSLDVSSLFNLRILDCSNNKLSALNVSPLAFLNSLNCSVNTISKLDCSKNRSLKALFIANSGLVELFIKNGSNDMVNLDNYNRDQNWSYTPNLNYICADDFEITSIKSVLDRLKKNTVLNSDCSFLPDPNFYVDFLDINFKKKLLEASSTNKIAKEFSGNYIKIDSNNDGEIQKSEALNVWELNFSNSKSMIYTGIGSFLNLRKLYCSNSNMYGFPGLSSLINLTYLDCSNNLISSLDISSLVNLTYLNCSTNSLTSLDVSSLVNLTYLNCGINGKLSSLNVSSLVNLAQLYCNHNRLSSLNVSSLVNLTALNCSYNELTTLNIEPLVNLTYFHCRDNKLTTLNVTSLYKLIELNCTYNLLNSLNVSPLVNLTYLSCDANRLSSLNVSQLVNLTYLSCSGNKLSSLAVSSLVNLKTLYCGNNLLSSINVSQLVNLNTLNCGVNSLSSLNVSPLVKLNVLYCNDNRLSSLDVSSLFNLTDLICGGNTFSSLNCSNNTKLEALSIYESPYLKEIFIKNGSYDFAKYEINGHFDNWYTNPNLKFICADEFEIAPIKKLLDEFKINTFISSYCSFVPGGTFYTIQGNQKIDANKNGCDANDIIMPNLKYTITNGTITGSIISDASGNYSIPVQAGTHTITPVFENPSYFSVSPTTVNVTFPTQTSPFIQNFCITANGVRPDLEVTLLPLQPARPGFDAKYKLVYKNKGNTIQSGSVNLTFTDTVLDLVVANPITTSQTTNNLSWSFTNLQPFETREITFTMNVNSPMETPAVNNGDILGYTAAITSTATDETPTDNTFTFNQTVVGSYDPNDKTCLEGSVITPNLIGEYVHYTIRFENTGTFAAENVVVKDMIDLTKFDIASLVPTSASHSYFTRITEGNKVEFIFENINLPFDDANNDGYIAFKIKTKPTLVVNDSFSNEASIFFDYNFPIVTNKATSTFKTLGTQDFDFDRYFTVYPNPAKSVLNITTKEFINIGTVNVYNTLGQLVLAIPNAEKVSNVDVSNLKSGNYFLQIKTDKGSSSSQFVKD